jgi:hypothetical protein
MPLNPAATDNIAWRISSKCDIGACVGVTLQGEFVLVGSTRDPDSLVVRFTHEEWSEFLAGAKLGDFDDL